MTEIQFLVSLMMDHKLAPAVKDKLIARIGEVEAQMSKPQIMVPHPGPIPQSTFSVRMPATEEHIPAVAPRKVVKQEVITGTGNGTEIRGPRKF